MQTLIQYLQNIQDNLVGIILPVLITAFISLVTVLINATVQIQLQNSKFNSEQYKIMQEFYPKLKMCLLDLKISMEKVENSKICSRIEDAIQKYIKIKEDEAKYRKNNENEIQFIDGFIATMNEFSTKVVDINKCFLTCTIPRTPIMHPFLKKKIVKMIAMLQYYSFLWDKYLTVAINDDVFKKEINNFKKIWNVKIGYKKICKYISLLDKWIIKY